jgi:transcriptional regulator with PAS, ATPase and Fis domain
MMASVIERCEKLVKFDKPTLIVGESGTGKELFAHAIHSASSRAKYPFVAINCAAIPANLLESELFGYEEGAFTGAKRGGKIGLFQTANMGTLFLDEIGELTLETQAKLLRVLEEQEIMKIGSDKIIKVDTKVIAATNRNLKNLVEEGAFRLDLYYRLNTLMVNIPPLRERPEDIKTLVHFFIKQEKGRSMKVSDTLMSFLTSFNWEGNIRELKNCVEYMVHLNDSSLDITDLPEYLYEAYLKSNLSVTDDAVFPELNSSDVSIISTSLRLIKSHTPGRRRLVDLLQQSDLPVSEHSVRTILQDLRERDYIVFGAGSAGCSITKKGEAFLTYLSKKTAPSRSDQPSSLQ